jgi:hypothetical protein
MVKLTEDVLTEFQSTANSGEEIEDEDCPGFMARKNADGSVSLQKKVGVHGRERVFNLGKLGNSDLAEARAKAEKMTEEKFISYR